VRTQHHVLVYDTGPRLSEELDSGEAVVAPFLQRQGIKKIDTIIVSHGHDDHSGGARSIVEKLLVDRVLTSDMGTVTKMLEPFENIYPCRAGQKWQWDGVYFAVLHPAANVY